MLLAVSLLFFGLVLVGRVSAGLAATVNSTGDSADASVGNGVCETAAGNGVCTLRAAIQESIPNVSTEIGINFSIPTSDPGYNAQTGAWTINLGSALPDLNKSSRLESTTLNIFGPGAKFLIVQRGNVAAQFRIFNVTTTGTVGFYGLTIVRGYVTASSGVIYGGGIQNLNSGAVNVINCTLSGNYAYVTNPSNGRVIGGAGGALSNNSTGILNVTNSLLSDNDAGWGGGGIYNIGTANVTGSTLTRNYIGYNGGFISGGGGAGIFNDYGGTLIVNNCSFLDNRTATSGYYPFRGGGIYNGGMATVTNSTLSNNSANFGGGISTYSGTTLTVANSTINANFANFADANGRDNFDNQGGGGGIHVGGSSGLGQNVMLNIVNSTISNNSGFASDVNGNGGGGVYAFMTGTANITNCTITGNSFYGDYVRGVGILGYGVKVKSSIVALNQAPSGPDVSDYIAASPTNSAGFNLIGKKDGSTGFTLATDKKGTIASPLNPKFDVKGLRNNGGPTETLALQKSSPAVDKGSSVGLTGTLTTDQRGAGFARKVDRAPANAAGGDGTDIGAFELGP